MLLTLSSYGTTTLPRFFIVAQESFCQLPEKSRDFFQICVLWRYVSVTLFLVRFILTCGAGSPQCGTAWRQSFPQGLPPPFNRVFKGPQAAAIADLTAAYP